MSDLQDTRSSKLFTGVSGYPAAGPWTDYTRRWGRFVECPVQQNGVKYRSDLHVELLNSTRADTLAPRRGLDTNPTASKHSRYNPS
jgi:hypothetical protein